jgi:hypothetical protein
VVKKGCKVPEAGTDILPHKGGVKRQSFGPQQEQQPGGGAQRTDLNAKMSKRHNALG